MNKEQAKGVTAARKAPVVIPKEDDPENQFLSHADYVKKNTARKNAERIGKEAAAKAYADAIGTSKEDKNAANKSEAEVKLEKAKENLARVTAKLMENPTSKVWLKKKQEAEDAVEVAESEV